MRIPKGYTEESVLQTIDEVVSFLSPCFTFGYYDKEDIEQEGRICAIEALPRYKSSKSGLKTFLMSHVRNRLRNLRRDKLIRLQSPCLDCSSFDSTLESQCDKYSDKQMCNKHIVWSFRNTSKRNIMEPAYDNMTTSIEAKKINVGEIYCQTELVQLIDEHIPISMRKDFCKILEGVTLPKFRHERLMTTINDILKEYYKDGDWQ